MFQFSTQFAMTRALVLNNVLDCLGSLSPVQDYLTGSVNWGCGRVFNLVLVRYSFLHPKVSVPHVLLVLRPWNT